MKQRTHEVRVKKLDSIIYVTLDPTTVPNPDRKFSRLKNKSQVFDDRRKRKPKYKTNYLDY